jgi:hypothetical protein
VPARTTTTLPPKPVAVLATWHLPVALSHEVVLPANNVNLGVFGGMTATGTSDKIYEIDPTTGTATAVGSLPVAVHSAGGAVIGSSYYVFGGGSTSETAAVQQFSFANTTTVTGSVIGNLPAKRAELSTVTVNNTVYLVGGFDGKAYLAGILSTSDGMSFTAGATLRPAVRYAAVAAANGMLYVIGGEVAPNAADSTAVQQVNLQSGTVTTLTPLPVGLSHAAAVVLNNTIYILGGRSGGHALATISQFNPATGQLTAVGTLPGGARSDMGVVVIGGTAYVVGGAGNNGQPLNTVVMINLSPGASG